MLRLKARATGLGPHQWPLRQRKGEKRVGDSSSGTEGKVAAETPGQKCGWKRGWRRRARGAAENAGRPPPGGWSGPGPAARPATGPGRGKRRGGGAAEEVAGLGVGRWGRAPRSAASGPEARGPGWTGGRQANGRRARRDCACARGPPEGRGRGGGARRGGGGDARSGPRTITNRSPFRPPPLSGPFPAPRDALTQAQGPCGPPAAAALAGGASVARSVPAAPLRRVPPPAPAPAAAPPLPVPLPLRQMPSGSPAPSCPASTCLSRSLFLRVLGASPKLSCRAPPSSALCSLSCPWFACSLRDLGLYLSFRCIPQSCVHITAASRWHSGQCAVTSR